MDDWAERIQDEGYRITGPRRAVIDVLAGAAAPMEAEEILVQARRRHSRLGLVTVYRTLDMLIRLNLVRRVHRRHGCRAFLPSSPGHHHAVLCRACGRAAEFEGGSDIDALIGGVERSTGYRVEDHLLQLSGLCPGCRT